MCRQLEAVVRSQVDKLLKVEL